jgi:hypothetical protein
VEEERGLLATDMDPGTSDRNAGPRQTRNEGPGSWRDASKSLVVIVCSVLFLLILGYAGCVVSKNWEPEPSADDARPGEPTTPR